MPRYAISPEGAAALRTLANHLCSCTNSIVDVSNSLEKFVQSQEAELGIYADAIVSILRSNFAALLANRESILYLAQELRKNADDIDLLTNQDFSGSSSGASAAPVSACVSVMQNYPQIQGEHTIESDLISVNPNFSFTDPDSPWNNNCQRCVCAYEARRRGYDVQALPCPEGQDNLPYMHHPEGWPTVFQGGKLIDCTANSGTAAAMNVESQMESWGDNCRAIVRVRWKPESSNCGHVFIAERVNGVTRFIDPQNGAADARSHFPLALGREMYCMRIDNLPFSDRIHQCIRRSS